MAELRATPYANPLTGLSNDAIQGLLSFMQDKRRTQQLQGLGNLLESTGIPKTVERAAYADSPRGLLDALTNVNRANVPLLKPETAEAIMNVAPFAAPVNRALMQATKGLPVGASIKPINLEKGIYKSDLTMEEMLKVRDIPTVERVQQSVGLVGEKEFEKMVNSQFKKYKPSTPEQEAMLVESVTLEILGKAQRSPYTQKEALEIAQKNAALPVEKGGLGLPKDNTPEMRAEAMGFDTPTYHGTNQDINIFNVERKGKTSGAGAFLTSNPTAAETYVSSSGGGNILPLLLRKDDFLTANARGRNWADISTNQLGAKAGKKRYTPEDLNLDVNSATSTDELGIIANELGLKGAEIRNVKDLGPNSHVMRAKEYLSERYGITPDETWSNVSGKQFDEAQKYMKQFYESQKGDIYAIQDPSLIRSRFAAFDPMRKNEPDILAGVLPLGLLADEEQRKKLYELMPSLLGQ
jgi:hypothetical protein